jgi:hypothetical protein
LKDLDPVCHYFRTSCAIIAGVCMSAALLGQSKRIPVRSQAMMLSVPFIGCNSDGQVGPLEAPLGTAVSVVARRDDGQKLAYYKSEKGVGALAPRGWYCFGKYGSGGDILYITPQPISAGDIFSAGPPGSDGPAIQVAYRFGGTSGRFAVAEIIARVFPAFKSFATDVMKEFGPDNSFTFGPYPADRLVYKSKDLVEYQTPPQTEGLGTYSGLLKSRIPIEGAARLVGAEHDLVLLSVRLPIEVNGLTATIISQLEHDSARCPCD